MAMATHDFGQVAVLDLDDGVVRWDKGVVKYNHYARQAFSRVDFQLGLPDGVRPSGAVSGANVCDDLVWAIP